MSSANTLSLFKACKIYRTSDQSEIMEMLQRNPLNDNLENCILIGSRAARYSLPRFRGVFDDKNSDWDFISSPKFLAKWIECKRKHIAVIDMIAPTSNNDVDDIELDLYIYIITTTGSKYDFTVPRSPTSYTAYILHHAERWILSSVFYRSTNQSADLAKIASIKLLLIFKKYMLYYTHQWEKTAKDYRELLGVAPPLTDDDRHLCDLFIQYNEKTHGKRAPNSDEFVIKSPFKQENMIVNRQNFVQHEKLEKISLMYEAAMLASSDDDILIGLEKICTQSPPWLSDFVIENLVAIQHEKFKRKLHFSYPCIKFDIESFRLFPELPEIPTNRIVHFINDTLDLYKMQLVCKQWYAMFRNEKFWQNLYISRYGQYSGPIENTQSWKMLYLIRLEAKLGNNSNMLPQLIDATIKLRRYTANHVLQLWENLTSRTQSANSLIMSKINYILSNSFYYEMSQSEYSYSVRLIIIGLENERSRSKVHLNVRFGEYGSSRFTDYMEQISIQYESTTKSIGPIKLFGPELLGFVLTKYGYRIGSSTLLSDILNVISQEFPPTLLMCLLVIMTHPNHRAQLIKYLKGLTKHCIMARCVFEYRGIEFEEYFNEKS